MDWTDLPDLPFCLILSYLSLQDSVKCRAVSRNWCKMIDKFRTTNLSFSELPIGLIKGKRRWASGAFAQNYIHSRFIRGTRFKLFVQTFSQSILANLKHLRLYEVNLDAKNAPSFAQALNSFDQLKELDIIRFKYVRGKNDPGLQLELIQPMLNIIQLERVYEIENLTLHAPKLKSLKIWVCDDFGLDTVHVESIEKLIIDQRRNIEVKKLKSMKHLKFLYLEFDPDNQNLDSTLLATLKELKEVHLYDEGKVLELFEQKERYGHVDLKIFLCGLLLYGPNDPAIQSLNFHLSDETFAYLAENTSRLAPEIPIFESFDYDAIERIPRGSEIDLLKRFTDLVEFYVIKPIQDIDRFLYLLENLNEIVRLVFECYQPQALFDRLPDHCMAVQSLTISSSLNFHFLTKLQNLIYLYITSSIDVESVRKIWEELQFLLVFKFKYLDKQAKIWVENHSSAKQFKVKVGDKETQEVKDLDSAILYIVENAKELD